MTIFLIIIFHRTCRPLACLSLFVEIESIMKIHLWNVMKIGCGTLSEIQFTVKHFEMILNWLFLSPFVGWFSTSQMQWIDNLNRQNLSWTLPLQFSFSFAATDTMGFILCVLDKHLFCKWICDICLLFVPSALIPTQCKKASNHLMRNHWTIIIKITEE